MLWLEETAIIFNEDHFPFLITVRIFDTICTKEHTYIVLCTWRSSLFIAWKLDA